MNISMKNLSFSGRRPYGIIIIIIHIRLGEYLSEKTSVLPDPKSGKIKITLS
jgi:hypothetical protein